MIIAIIGYLGWNWVH